jgi:hypothetical protein
MPHWNLLVEQVPLVYWWNDVLIVSNSEGVFIRGNKRSLTRGHKRPRL